jgi:anti-sigma factor RsiW
LNCRECIEFLLDYSAGELPPETRALFLGHLERCPPCVAYLESYEQTVKLARGACRRCEAGAAAEVPEDLILAILSVRESSDRR